MTAFWSLFNKVACPKLVILLKETPTQVFTCEYCEIFKNHWFWRFYFFWFYLVLWVFSLALAFEPTFSYSMFHVFVLWFEYLRILICGLTRFVKKIRSMSMCTRDSARETVFLNSQPAQLGYPGLGGTAIPAVLWLWLDSMLSLKWISLNILE